MTLAEANQHAKLQLDQSSASEVTTLWRYTNLFIIIIIIIIIILHGDQVISRVSMSASCLVGLTMSTVHGCDRQTDMTMKNTLLN